MKVPGGAADASGNSERIVEGKTGRLFKPGSSQALAQALSETLADLPAAKTLARAGAAVVAERFSDKASVRLTMDYYAKLAERAR